ncbi:MAG: hypothetical protein LBT70_02725 [Holosporaceae bacterium]|jgi:hypothetical protein|nr:hypothetical protein [Holosporaceae bacterium]
MKPHIQLVFFALFFFVLGSVSATQLPVISDPTSSNNVVVAPVATNTNSSDSSNLKDLHTQRQADSIFDIDFFYRSLSQKFDPQTAKIMASVCIKNTEQMSSSDIHLAVARSLDSCEFGKSRPIIDRTVRLWKRIRTFLGVLRNVSLVTAGTSTILCAVFPQWRDILFIVTEISGPLAAALWPTCTYAQKRADHQIEQNFIENLMKNSLRDAENGAAINPPEKLSASSASQTEKKSPEVAAITGKKQTSSKQKKIISKSSPKKSQEQGALSSFSDVDTLENVSSSGAANNSIIVPIASHSIAPSVHCPLSGVEQPNPQDVQENYP